MATIATRLRNFLKTKTTVTDYVQDRIAETRLPQNKAEPYIILRRSGTENADVLNGSVGAAPLWHGVSIECVSRNERTANAVGDAVRTCLHLYRGTFDDATAKGCFVETESLDFESDGNSSDDGKFTRTLETRIFL